MTREIKFRAWDKMCCEWLHAEPFYGFFPDVHMQYERGENTDEHYGDIQQFTGIKDAKGNDIYEGDVLRVHSISVGQYQGEVFYCDGMFSITDKKDITEPIWKPLKKEVIGNIYETPELLEPKNQTS